MTSGFLKPQHVLFTSGNQLIIYTTPYIISNQSFQIYRYLIQSAVTVIWAMKCFRPDMFIIAAE